jgi:hypothetical protein
MGYMGFGPGFGPGFDMGFGMFQIMFGITFILILGVFVVTIVRGIGEWNKNNHSPRITVPVTVVSKRTDVSRHHRAGDHHHHHTTTSYYATFQLASGDRMEFLLSGGEYGMLVEGDFGDLTFQGTRYLSFERK